MKLDFILRELRDKELYSNYCRIRKVWIDEGKSFSRKEILVYVLENCQPRYHFTFDYARRLIRCFGEPVKLKSGATLHQQQWNEISNKVHEYRTKFPRKSLSDAVQEVLAFGRASKYFITYNYAKRIIYEMDKKPVRSIRA